MVDTIPGAIGPNSLSRNLDVPERTRRRRGFHRAFSNGTRVRVMDAGGDLVRTVGRDPAFPVLTRTHSFEDGGRVIGWVETAVSLLPVFLETVLVFALSCGLAVAVVMVLRRLPLRVLDEAIARLDDMFTTLEQSEIRLKEAQRIAHLGSWSYDYAGTQMAWSREVGRILGLPAECRCPSTSSSRQSIPRIATARAKRSPCW